MTAESANPPQNAVEIPAEADAGSSEADKNIPLWSYHATNALVGVNILVFLIMSSGTPLAWFWRHGVWSQMFTWVFDYNRLAQFGGCSLDAVQAGQWWRVVTAIFVHANVLHLLLNMWCLWNLGLFGERLLGRWGLIATYILTGSAGNLLSLAWSAFPPRREIMVVGASGAVFGFAGILIILLSNRGLLAKNPGLEWKELSSLRLQVIFFAAVNLVFGYLPALLPASLLAWLHIDIGHMPPVDNSAHLGGFLSGLALGLPLFPRMTVSKTSYRARQRATFAIAALLLCLFGTAVQQLAAK